MEPNGNPTLADCLKAARLRAGFRSARAAAIANNWPEGTYRAHETGTRSINMATLRRYEDAFGQRLNPLDATFEKFEDVKRARAGVEAQAVLKMAARLRLARLLCGFQSIKAAVDSFGFKRSAYSAHENGYNRFSERHAEAYGLAYRVEPKWLLTGKGPIGLENHEDEKFILQSNILNSPSEFYFSRISIQSRNRAHGPPQQVREILHRPKKLTNERTENENHTFIKEIFNRSSWLSAGQDPGHLCARRTWGIPEDIAYELISHWPERLVVFAASTAIPDFHISPGDRIFVERSVNISEKIGPYVILAPDSKLNIVNDLASLEHDEQVLGRLVGRFLFP